MKYTISPIIREILTSHGLLGFDTVQECESAIMKDQEWWKNWDTTDWESFDKCAVISWREGNIAANTVHEIAIDLTKKCFGL